MSIGKKLRELLKAHEISERELARHIGISPDRLRCYLEDKREPSLQMLNQIAIYLSVTLDYFIEPDNPQNYLCKGIKLSVIEDIHYDLDKHQKLIDYLIYEIADISNENLDTKHVYTYMLALSNAKMEKICKQLDTYIMNIRKSMPPLA